MLFYTSYWDNKLYSFFFFFLAALGLHRCARAFLQLLRATRLATKQLFVAVLRLLIAVASLVVEHGLQVDGLWQLQHMGSAVVARGLQSAGSVVWHTVLVAPQHVGSSRTRDQTRVPCIGRRILNHCTTKEVPKLYS